MSILWLPADAADVLGKEFGEKGVRRLSDSLQSAGLSCAENGRPLIIGTLSAQHLSAVAKKINEVEKKSNAVDDDEGEGGSNLAIVVVQLSPQFPFAEDLIARAKIEWKRDIVLVPPLKTDDDFEVAAAHIIDFLAEENDEESVDDESDLQDEYEEEISLSDDMQTLHDSADALKANNLELARAILQPYIEQNERTSLVESLILRLVVQSFTDTDGNTANEADVVMRKTFIAKLEKCSTQLTSEEEGIAGVGAFLLAYKAHESMSDVM